MRRTYDPAPLAAAAARRGITDGDLAARLGLSRAAVRKWRQRGGVPERWADAAAVAVGLLPGELWAEWDAHALADVDAKEAARRARRAKRARERYATDAEYRERIKAASRAYKANAKAVQRVKQSLRLADAANRERKNALERQRWHEGGKEKARTRYQTDAEYRARRRARQRAYDRRRAAERRGVLLHAAATSATTSTSHNAHAEAS